MLEVIMKKVFIVAGELSGDKLGQWYVERFLKHKETVQIEAVGGDCLQRTGAEIFQRFETLNVTGIIEIVRKLPFILKNLKKLARYIVENDFDEVVLIDFPGFNLKLAQKLKQMRKNIRIVYFSPPQLWCWGAWRIKKLKKYCDELIVLYPFEVQWYAKRGVNATWHGSPVYDRLQEYFERADQPKKKRIAIMPGSRTSEIENMFYLFAGAMKKFLDHDPTIEFVIPVAQSLSRDLITNKIKEEGLEDFIDNIELVFGEHDKLQALSTCCLAITKPGTVTLELALLGVPAVVLFRTSWINYFIGYPLVKVEHMALPNLLLKEQMYTELIQGDCTVKNIFKQAHELYQHVQNDDDHYRILKKKVFQLRDLLSQE